MTPEEVDAELNARPAEWITAHAIQKIFLALAVRYDLDTDDDTVFQALMDDAEQIATRMHATLTKVAEAKS